MQARDIMSTRVITVSGDTSVSEIAGFMTKFNVSAVPVIDTDNKILGMVSEGDLLRRPELGTDKRRHSWWLGFLVDRGNLAKEFVKSHGIKAQDIMTKPVIAIDEDTPIEEIAEILEKNQIKRVPVMRGNRLVGLVSRANIVQQLACGRKINISVSKDDKTVREEVEKILNSQPWASSRTTSVTVHGGAVELWGFIESDAEREASRVALEPMTGVRSLEDHRSVKTSQQIAVY